MWPMLLNMTRDDCRRTLRRLELEAYSNMISVFRAQGALEESTKKLLEELRTVLHISNDRHSAEARRVANDEILATIAEQLAGPNTGLGWISEGKRKVPLMPRGIPQTMYTDIADKAAQAAAAENKEIQKRLEAEKLVTPKSNEEEMPEVEGETAESAISANESLDELMYAPVVMEDQTTKIWETEVMGRKRKITESNIIEENTTTPVKNVRNIMSNSNQKHPNLSQLYSKYSQPAPSKQQQSKHSYNQVGKVSSKSNQVHTSRSVAPKHRKQNIKHSSQIVLSKTQVKKSQEPPVSSAKSYNQVVTQVEYTGPPNTFQATYAQSVLGHKPKLDYIEEMKPKIISPPGMMTDSPTLQLLTQPATVPHDLGVSDGAHSDDPTSLQAQAAPTSKAFSSKPCHIVIKKRNETAVDRKQTPDLKVLHKTSDSIKFIPNRPVVVAPGSMHKTSGKFIATKIVNQIPRPQNTPTILSSDKMIVVSKPSEHKHVSSSKIIICSTSATTPVNKTTITVSANSISPKTPENISAKGIPATDLKVSAKTFLLNPKSGQKMVVLPAKGRTKTPTDGQTVPILHFKNIPPTMKLLPVTSQSFMQMPKSSTMTTVPKTTVVNAVSASNAKVVSMEPIKTANMADIVPVKGFQPITTTPKPTNAIIRPATSKGNVIVVQKGANMSKALSFTKNGNDMSKIIMGKNVNQLLQASNTLKQDQKDGVSSGNVIVLELNNDQSARTTTISKILESHTSKSVPDTVVIKNELSKITEDTPVLFDSQITEETCNASSLDSAVESMGVDVQLDETELSMLAKEGTDKSDFNKNGPSTRSTASTVADWDMGLHAVASKVKEDEDKLNSLHLDLGMSSDSDTEYVVGSHKSKRKHSPQQTIQQATPGGETFGSSVGLTHASRLLLSQLQDEGSSSNDSSFALNKGKVPDKQKEGNIKDLVIEKSECEALNKAKEKLSEKVAEPKSQRKRIDIYSTAISSSDINLDEFSYLEEGLMAGDEMFAQDAEHKGHREMKEASLDMQLRQLLGEAPGATHSVSENLNK